MSKYISDLMERARSNTGCKSNYKLAKYLGVSQAAVSGWSTGRTHPTGAPAMKLAEAAGVDPGALVLWGLANQAMSRWGESGQGAMEVLKHLPKAMLVPRRSGLNPWG